MKPGGAPETTPPYSRSRARWIGSIVLALALGGLGGWLGKLVGLPLPWMIGALLATTAAAIAGLPVAMATPLRTAMTAILGVLLGSRFAPEILGQAGQWLISLSMLVPFIVVSTALGYVYFRRHCGYDRITAYFSATPGGLQEMVLVGSAMGGDSRRISLTHTTRILIVVLTLPFAFSWLLGYQPGSRPAGGPLLAAASLEDLAVLTVCAVTGYLGARSLRIPAASIIGPMAVSAAVHLAGLSRAAPPVELVAMAQVAVGTALGARFAGTKLRFIWRTILQSVGVTAIMVTSSLAFATLLHFWQGFPEEELVLAFAPGGLTEMSLIALALGRDAAFVAIHHILRIFLVIVSAAPTFKLLRRFEERRQPTPP